MTCREAIAVLGEYLEATLDSGAGAELETHLAECDECAVYLATYRRTVGVVGDAARVEMPDELRRRLRDFLLRQLDRARP
ncbi:MAG TPA: zf-HC2 domain-containing protein [Methylomirabilota bacterium]|nr:zf-HC2 domain-containing protein [Methylomirabilota bacterium]